MNFPRTSSLMLLGFWFSVQVFLWSYAEAAAEFDPQEREALLRFKGGLEDSRKFLESWTQGTDCCSWYGITCNETTGYVVELDLNHQCILYAPTCFPLNGTLDTALFELKYLQQLQLSYHIGINGSIPKEVGQLQNLKNLGLSSNQIVGTIPSEIGNLGNLQSLHLSDNRIEGGLPQSLCRLKKLLALSLGQNKLIGTIPTCLSSLTSLQYLSLRDNRLEGSVPLSLGQLANLSYLHLQGNFLNGQVLDSHFLNLSKLEELKLSSNSLEIHDIPADWIPPFREVLRVLYLDSCHVGPDYPPWIRLLENLYELNLSNTSIQGYLPQWFAETIPFQYLNLSNNDLHGNLPGVSNITPSSTSAKVWDLSSNHFNGPLLLPNITFEFIDISSNQFNGPIPLTYLNDSSSPSAFHAVRNNFSGQIPTSLGTFRIRSLDLSYNQLTGSIPWEVGNCTYLVALDLSGNRLSGQIPSSLGQLQYLQSLHLSDNNFSGMLPPELKNWTMLQTLDLGGNSFSGRIPKWIGVNLSDLRVLRLRSNLFSGEIPPEIMNLQSLHVLDIAHNLLSGPIPSNVGNLSAMRTRQTKLEWMLFGKINFLRGTISYFRERIEVQRSGQSYKYTRTLTLLTSFDLSSNNLPGVISGGLTNLAGLIVLNLSHNHLSKEMPTSIGNLVNLDTLDLSTNSLYGRIPLSLSNIPRMGLLNLSYNNLSGEIPMGFQIQTLDDPSIYRGNDGLCGSFLKKDCNGKKTDSNGTVTPTITFTMSDGYEVGIYVSIVVGFVVGFWCFVGPLLFRKSLRVLYLRFLDSADANLCNAIAVVLQQLKKLFRMRGR